MILGEGPARPTRWLRSALATSTAVMILCSWPLWTGDESIPRVPFVAGWPQFDGTSGVLLATALVVAVVLSGVLARWRAAYVAGLSLLIVLVLGDQHRFQPWAYQYAIVGLCLAGLPEGTGLRYARGCYVALYTHSALSKFDVSFRDELGTLLLATALRPFGLDPLEWDSSYRTAAVISLPAAELLTGLTLASGRIRSFGLAGATALHLVLIAVLGPFGLGHSRIVQFWNLAMLVEVWVAFGPTASRAGPPLPARSGRALGALVRAAFWGSVILPFGERWGRFDPWPSHALYASHVDRLFLDAHESALPDLPEGVRKTARRVEGTPWLRLDPNRWSLETRGAPLYPGNRAWLGLAEGLAARYGGPGPFRVVLFGPADRWSGRRPRTEIIGAEAIRGWGDRYRLNAHPSPTRSGSTTPPVSRGTDSR